MATQYKTGETVQTSEYGDVTIVEAHEATENSPEQYTVVTTEGNTVRTPLPAREAVEAPVSEPSAPPEDTAK